MSTKDLNRSSFANPRARSAKALQMPLVAKPFNWGVTSKSLPARQAIPASSSNSSGCGGGGSDINAD